MNLISIQIQLKKYEQDYNDKIHNYCEKIRTELVIPFCRKHRFTFISGMGSWVFSDENNKTVFIEDFKKYSVMNVQLSECIPHWSQDVGSYMSDVSRDEAGINSFAE
jgi:hypothetical protein